MSIYLSLDGNSVVQSRLDLFNVLFLFILVVREG